MHRVRPRASYPHSGDRSGFFFALVLLVLFVLSVTIGALQYLSIETFRQTRMILESEDAQNRAVGILRLLISRWKKRIGYQSLSLLESAASGSEAGTWDSKPFTFGWERESLRTHPPSDRISVWVRLTEEKPLRTFRFDLKLRTCSALDPRIVEVVGLTVDSVDPASESQRQEAFRLDPLKPASDIRKQATAEVYTSRLRGLAAQEKTPAEVEAALAPSSLTPAIDGLERFLGRHASYQDEKNAASRVAAARLALQEARGLPDEDRTDWTDLAQFTLAGELSRAAETEGPGTREATFLEAVTHLKQILDRSSECCGAAKVSWRLAQITMRMRPDLASPAVLATAKAAARSALSATTSRSTTDPVHDRTDITRGELPRFLEDIWRARVAVGLTMQDGRFLLASMRQDGSAPVIHLESATRIRPLSWSPDGGQIYATVGDGRTLPTIWRLSVDGLDISEIFTDPVPYGVPGQGSMRWRYPMTLEHAGGGRAYLARGNLSRLGTTNNEFMSTSMVGVKGSDVAAIPGFLCPSPGSCWQAMTAVFSDTDERLAVCRYIQRSTSDLEYRVEINGHFFESPEDPSPTVLVSRLISVSTPFVVNDMSWVKFGPDADWIAQAATRWAPEIGVEIRFVNAARPPPSPETIVVLPAARGIVPRDAKDIEWSGRRGALARDPPGYLWAEAEKIHFIPLPPASQDPANRKEWPTNRSFSDIRFLHAPRWGRKAFFEGTESGGGGSGGRASGLYVLDLVAGRAVQIAGQGGGRIPMVTAAERPEVSPIPEAAP